MTIDPWPNDVEGGEICICGHILVQHEYGSYYANCYVTDEPCPCDNFEPRHAYIDAHWVGEYTAYLKGRQDGVNRKGL